MGSASLPTSFIVYKNRLVFFPYAIFSVNKNRIFAVSYACFSVHMKIVVYTAARYSVIKNRIVVYKAAHFSVHKKRTVVFTSARFSVNKNRIETIPYACTIFGLAAQFLTRANIFAHSIRIKKMKFSISLVYLLMLNF